MSTEENKVIIRRLHAAVNSGDLDAIEVLATPDFADHSPPSGGGDRSGSAHLRQDVILLRTMLPDLQVTLEDLVSEGDKVGVRGITRGTHRGEVTLGPGLTVTPTGNHVTFSWSAIYRIAGGRIAERWLNGDDLSSWQQLGIIPPMGRG